MLRLGPSEAVLYRADRDGGADSDPTARLQVVLLWWRTHNLKNNPRANKLARDYFVLLPLTDLHGISHAHLRKGQRSQARGGGAKPRRPRGGGTRALLELELLRRRDVRPRPRRLRLRDRL